MTVYDVPTNAGVTLVNKEDMHCICEFQQSYLMLAIIKWSNNMDLKKAKIFKWLQSKWLTPANQNTTKKLQLFTSLIFLLK